MTTLFTALHVIRFRNERGECELLLLQAAQRRLHRGDRGELPSAEERESLRVQAALAAHRRLHRGARGELPSAEERAPPRLQAAHRRLHRGAQSRASRCFSFGAAMRTQTTPPLF